MGVWATPMYGPHGRSTISVKYAAQKHKIKGYTSENIVREFGCIQMMQVDIILSTIPISAAQCQQHGTLR